MTLKGLRSLSFFRPFIRHKLRGSWAWHDLPGLICSARARRAAGGSITWSTRLRRCPDIPPSFQHSMMLLDGTDDLLLRSVTHEKHITFACNRLLRLKGHALYFFYSSAANVQRHALVRDRASESTLGAFYTPRPTSGCAHALLGCPRLIAFGTWALVNNRDSGALSRPQLSSPRRLLNSICRVRNNCGTSKQLVSQGGLPRVR
jgi:hypothetical protein